MKTMTKITDTVKRSEEEFDELWSGGLKRKYGDGFALYCSNCGGNNEEKIKAFLKSAQLNLLKVIEEWANENWSRSYNGENVPLGEKMITLHELLALLSQEDLSDITNEK